MIKFKSKMIVVVLLMSVISAMFYSTKYGSGKRYYE